MYGGILNSELEYRLIYILSKYYHRVCWTVKALNCLFLSDLPRYEDERHSGLMGLGPTICGGRHPWITKKNAQAHTTKNQGKERQ